MAVVTPTIMTTSAGRNPVRTPGNTVTISHTHPAGANAMLVRVAYDTFSQTEPLVTFNGQTVPLWHSIAPVQKQATYLLLNPTPMTANVVSTAQHPTFDTSQAVVVHSIANFAAIRWGEYPQDFFETTIDTNIYTQSTDLLIDLFAWGGNGFSHGQTVTEHAGQTVIVTQSGVSDFGVRIAVSRKTPTDMGSPPVQSSYSTMGWTLSAATGWTHFPMAIKGLDLAAPVGAPEGLGRMTHTCTFDQQPPGNVTVTDAAWTWRWRHEIPPTHPFLAVTVLGWDTPASAVYWQPDGGVEEALTEEATGDVSSVWILASPTIGQGYLRVVLTGRRWYGASAYSLATQGIIAFAARAGSLAPSLDIPSSDGAIVVDHIGNLDNNFRAFTPTSPQTGLFWQPIMGNGNTYEAVAAPASLAGAGSWTLATGTPTTMAWTLNAASVLSHQAGFSFLATEQVIEELDLPIRRLRRAPVLNDERRWMFHGALRLDLKRGIGLDGASTTQGHDPQVMLRYSDNGAKTWSNEKWVSAGKIGAALRRAQWRRLGRTRNRIYEIVVSDPNAWQLIAAYLDLEGGTS